MANTNDTIDPVTTKLLAWSRICHDSAQLLLRQAKLDFSDGALDATQYNDLFEGKYLPLVQSAVTLNNAAFTQLAALAAVDLAPIDVATRKLSFAITTVDTVQTVITLSAELVGAVGLVVAAVMDPTKASVVGAGYAIESFTRDLVEATTAEKK